MNHNQKRAYLREVLFNPRYGRKTGKLDIFDGREINDSDDVFSDEENERDVRIAIAKVKAQRAEGGPPAPCTVGQNDQEPEVQNLRFPLFDAGPTPDSPLLSADDEATPPRKRRFFPADRVRGKKKMLYELIVDDPSPSPKAASETPCRKTLEFEEEESEKVAAAVAAAHEEEATSHRGIPRVEIRPPSEDVDDEAAAASK